MGRRSPRSLAHTGQAFANSSEDTLVSTDEALAGIRSALYYDGRGAWRASTWCDNKRDAKRIAARWRAARRRERNNRNKR